MESNGTTMPNGVGAAVIPTSNGHPKATASTTITSSNVPEYHRLCHVLKRQDFSGYGFHLHAEKGKPGQFIGKVDPDSPAEEAGMRQGDRIIEVNGVAIQQETHKEVVERIKALEQEVRLLVLDASQDPTGAALAKKDTSASTYPPTNGTATKTTTTTTLEKKGQNGNAMKIESVAAAQPMTVGPKDDLNSDLQLSVAEFRAKLANKKKVDPKRESDMKKKYEMVQML